MSFRISSCENNSNRCVLKSAMAGAQPKVKAKAKPRIRFNPADFDMEGGQHARHPLDPRTLGEGPCGRYHSPSVNFQVNQHACWKRCMVCSLRMEYHSKWTAHGSRRTARPTPEIVRRALELAGNREDMSAKIMDGLIQIAEGERMSGKEVVVSQRAQAGGGRGGNGNDRQEPPSGDGNSQRRGTRCGRLDISGTKRSER